MNLVPNNKKWMKICLFIDCWQKIQTTSGKNIELWIYKFLK